MPRKSLIGFFIFFKYYHFVNGDTCPEYCGVLHIRAGYRYAGKSAPLPSFASAGFGLKLFGASLEGCYLFASPTLGRTMMFSFAYDF